MLCYADAARYIPEWAVDNDRRAYILAAYDCWSPLMSLIFYKFKSAKDFDSYKFDGAGIPAWELKREIVQAKKLGKTNDFDLILTNATTNEGIPLREPFHPNVFPPFS